VAAIWSALGTLLAQSAGSTLAAPPAAAIGSEPRLTLEPPQLLSATNETATLSARAMVAKQVV
jgi:hypothetical protein